MFESNFPPDKVAYSYPIFWNACKLLTKGASVTEKADLSAGKLLHGFIVLARLAEGHVGREFNVR
jgi:hypothetical protein